MPHIFDVEPERLDTSRCIRQDPELDDYILESIATFGIRHPIEAYWLDNKWFVLSGMRRVAAAKLLEIKWLPVMEVKPPTNFIDCVAQQVMHNVSKPLSHVDISHACIALEVTGLTRAEIATLMHMRTHHVFLAMEAAKQAG